MGRAIVRDADAFLFDEPLSNLDAKLRGQMRSEISRLQKKLGITTVYVTHDQTEAMTLGDRVAVLKRGLLQQLATPRELYGNPGNLFVAGFIGSPPMNFLPATVEGNTVELPFGKVEIPAEKAEKAQGKGLLIAGIRPEALRGRLGGRQVGQRVDVHRHGRRRGVAGQRGLRLHARSRRRPRCASSSSSSSATWTARPCAPSSSSVSRRLQPKIKEGDEAEIWVDTSKMHLFDPATGENLTVDLENAGEIPGHASKQPATPDA